MVEDKEFCLDEFRIKQYQADLFKNNYKMGGNEEASRRYKNDEVTYLTWEQLDKHIDEIVEKIKDKKYVGVYGVPRGGLLIALIISYKIGLPLLSSAIDNCLVVDDAVSTGVAMLPYIKRYDTYAIVVDENAPYTTTYYNYHTKELIYFPWDK